MPRSPHPDPVVLPRLRVLLGDDIALGPGKVALLGAIAEHGTLAEAAKRLGMSYMRAWRLVQTMNACFARPLVATARGGTQKGQAALTPDGEAVLGLYRQMDAASRAALEPAWRELLPYLAPIPPAADPGAEE